MHGIKEWYKSEHIVGFFLILLIMHGMNIIKLGFFRFILREAIGIERLCAPLGRVARYAGSTCSC
jgi:hypothetical protein